jgi:hypothetical protein
MCILLYAYIYIYTYIYFRQNLRDRILLYRNETRLFRRGKINDKKTSNSKVGKKSIRHDYHYYSSLLAVVSKVYHRKKLQMRRQYRAPGNSELIRRKRARDRQTTPNRQIRRRIGQVHTAQ